MSGRERHMTNDEGGVSYFRNWIVRVSVGLAVILNLVAWPVLFFGVSRHREAIILHYNVYLGVDMIGAYWQIFLIPAAGILFELVNIVLGWYLYRGQERIGAYMLLLAGVMVEFGALIASITIALVNY